MRQLCQYCEPIAAHPWHMRARFEDFLNLFVRIFRKPVPRALNNYSWWSFKAEKVFVSTIIRLLTFFGIASVIPINEENKHKISARTRVIVEEAARRGYVTKVVKVMNMYTELFYLVLLDTSLLFCALPLLDFTEESNFDFDDKYCFKIFLRSNKFPYVPGNVFSDIHIALRYGIRLGFPLVVKPRSGSLSRHTTVDVNNKQELQEAIIVAKKISREFIVEKFVVGKNYRITVVGDKMVAVALREPPSVVGDGVHSIKDLIISMNDHRVKSESARAAFHLGVQGYSLATILEKGTRAYLDTKIIIAAGAHIHDVTDEVHAKNIELIEQISGFLGARIVGFDVIATDISRSYEEGSFSIIEANSAPYIDMHHYPYSGLSRNVAAVVLDEVEKRRLVNVER